MFLLAAGLLLAAAARKPTPQPPVEEIEGTTSVALISGSSTGMARRESSPGILSAIIRFGGAVIDTGWWMLGLGLRVCVAGWLLKFLFGSRSPKPRLKPAEVPA